MFLGLDNCQKAVISFCVRIVSHVSKTYEKNFWIFSTPLVTEDAFHLESHPLCHIWHLLLIATSKYTLMLQQL